MYFVVFVFLSTGLVAQETGTFIDERDGNEYKWVKIGEQTWMSENMAYLPEISPTDDILENISGYYVYDFYENNVNSAREAENYKIYGVLYNWDAAFEACPDGWHLPDQSEWNQLAEYITSQFGGNFDLNGYWRLIGQPLKSKGTIEDGNGLWLSTYDTKTGIDLFGFSGFPGGRFIGGDFSSLGEMGIWWAFDEENDTSAKTVVLHYYFTQLYINAYNKTNGLSVRCIKD